MQRKRGKKQQKMSKDVVAGVGENLTVIVGRLATVKTVKRKRMKRNNEVGIRRSHLVTP